MEFLNHRGIKIPKIGLGTWKYGEDNSKKEKELSILMEAIDTYGMLLLDTAEMYGEGKSEILIGSIWEKISREKIFLVDKVYPWHMEKKILLHSVRNSLKRLNTNYIDLYLLHWNQNNCLEEVVENMEDLVQQGYIRHWGVSNFSQKEMEELFKIKNGSHCFANQILYNLKERGPEYDLIPWCQKNDVLTMVYSPLGNNRTNFAQMESQKEIQKALQEEKRSFGSFLLQFAIRLEKMIAIFGTSSSEHLKENMDKVFYPFKRKTLERIDKVYPTPSKAEPLKMI